MPTERGGGGTMIDLSHLTEEEQGMIMAVLRRDAELKKAEEERISKLETLNSGSKLDSKWKYLTGEWFYEVKSRRHMDKIHGSEIILASMKQKKAGLDGSLRSERFKTPSSQGSDLAPPKPAQSLEAPRLQDVNDAEKENLSAGIRSPRTPRHNPFNQASLIAAETPEYDNDMSINQHRESSETDNITPLRSHPAAEASQYSGGSITSEASSAGFRPVPRKRTFLSKRTSSGSERSLGLDVPAGSAGVVPAPRRRLQRGSSGDSDQSYLKGQDERPQKSIVSNQMSSQPLNENSQQPLHYVPQTSSNSSLERERSPPSLARERPSTCTRSDEFTERESPLRPFERNGKTHGDLAAANAAIPHTGSVQHSDREDSVRTTMKQEELSLPQSTVEPGEDLTERGLNGSNMNSFTSSQPSVTPGVKPTGCGWSPPPPKGSAGSRRASLVDTTALSSATKPGDLTALDPDPPVSYDLNFIDKADEQTKKSNQRHMFKLSTQNTSPTGDEDSIAKVLDWFSRSTDTNDWLNTEDGTDATNRSGKHVEISNLRGEDSLEKEAGDRISNRKKETRGSNLRRQTNDSKEFRETDRIGNKELAETQEVMKDTREKMTFDDNNDEIQPISRLKSYSEASNMDPNILTIKSIDDKGQKPPAENDVEKVNKPIEIPDFPFLHGIYNWKGNNGVEREQEPIISPQKDTGNIVDNSNQEVMNSSIERDSDYFKSADHTQVVERRVPDTEIQSVTRLSPQPTAIQSRLTPESESVKANQQPDSIPETFLQDKPSTTIPVSHMTLDLQTRDSSDSSEKHYFPRNTPYMGDKQTRNEMQTTPRIQRCREDVTRMDFEDESMESSMFPKRKEDISNELRINSPQFNRLPHQETPAEKIRQLRSLLEQEKRVMYYTPKALGDDKVIHGANQARLDKRFTKSEYDLRSISNYSGNEEQDYDENHQNITVFPLNQRMEQSYQQSYPSPRTSRTQFNMLREFWDEATSDTKGFFSCDKAKSPKRKEPLSAQLHSPDLKCGDPEIYREKTRPAAMKSSPPLQSQAKSPPDRQFGSRTANYSRNNPSNYMIAEQQRESKRILKDSNREEKSIKPQNNPGRETRSPKSRKDSFGNSSSRANSMRRATSMFALNVPDVEDQMDVIPVHSQSRKQWQNTEKGTAFRRSSEETPTPLARACVPRDYRHYLGMTDETGVLNSFAPALDTEGSEGKSRFEFDQVGPVRASTPVSSEEHHSRKGSKMSQRSLWTKYSSSDTGQESSVSSASDTWSNSRNSSNRENDDDEHPVRKALRRAEARPKILTKSLEDITASVSPRQERRQDPTADMRRISNISSIPSPSSLLFSDPDHLKKMSKSVPLFLENEDIGGDTDSNYEDNYYTQSRMMATSSNLTNSSGMASLSGSVMTMYSGDFSNVEVQGNIQFSINYIQMLKEFHIFVAECRGLAAVDLKRGRSDPYVKSYLVPDKANLGKRKTSVKKKTLNPTFNEILRYRVRMEYLRTKMLILSVWHHDTFGRNSFLGEVDVDLSNWDFDHTQMNYLALKGKTFQNTPSLPPSNGRGEMRLAIRFLPKIIHSEGSAKEGPNNGELHIWVKECRNLLLVRATIDPYVKCFVLPDTSRKSRQKTRVLRRTVDPAFNHTMVYDGIREADLAEACVELSVWDRDKLASNLLGGVRLGVGTGTSYGAVVDWMDSTPYEVALWERMKATPNEWVEDVLPLRRLNSAKTAFK